MTIDEAIEHAEERACGNDQCAKDHAQLADWLRELRRARMEIDLLKTLRDGFKADARKYKAENSMLRERLLESRESNEHLYTELRRYKSIFRMKPRAMNALFDENSKLRELVSYMYRLMDESCAVQHPYAPEPIRYDTLMDIHEKLCELGIGVMS